MRAQTHQIGGVRPTTFAIPAGFADDTTHVRPDVGPHTVSVDEYLGQHNAEANTLRTLRSRLRYATEVPRWTARAGFGLPYGLSQPISDGRGSHAPVALVVPLLHEGGPSSSCHAMLILLAFVVSAE